MDYHIIGFRECASEVARYLVTIEGMDIQDPLRLRLMSHLQCFVAQRELSAKSSATGVSSSSWSSLQSTYQPNYPSQAYQGYATSPITSQQQHNTHHQGSSYHMLPSSSSSSYLSTSLTPQALEYNSSGYGTTNNSSTSSTTASSNNISTTSPDPIPTTSEQVDSQQPIYTDLSNTNDRLGGSYNQAFDNTSQVYASANVTGYNNNNSKPYRPWHQSLAY